jgi:2-hydroxy-3-keto-5-methylthiopentenyl-1-phosphate phosphatase
VSNWIVLCDFDGTVSQEDVTDSLLVRFGLPGWDTLEVDWREGRIGSRACMAGQVALLECSRDELDEHLATMTIDPDFAQFVTLVRRSGAPLRIVSDGLDYAIHSILARHGLGDLAVTASHLVPAGPRRWALEFPHARSDCLATSGTCKCALAGPPFVAAPSRVLMVGDGASDFCVAQRADLTFARKRLLKHCVERGLNHRAVANFAQAVHVWPEVLALPAINRAFSLSC